MKKIDAKSFFADANLSNKKHWIDDVPPSFSEQSRDEEGHSLNVSKDKDMHRLDPVIDRFSDIRRRLQFTRVDAK
jgi:hypothetical protein